MVIDGRALARQILFRIRKQTLLHPSTLAIVQIGHRPDSDIYIRQKIRAAEVAGIEVKKFYCQLRSSQASVLRLLHQVSRDSAIDGILLQLPVPSHLDTQQLLAAIDPKKDVDGFHPASTVTSPLIQAIERCIVSSKKKSGSVMILGRQSIFTHSLADRLQHQGYTVREATAERRIPTNVKEADIIITVRGQGPRLLPHHVKKGAVVIDGGIRRFEQGISGDADPAIASVVSAYTPVPGGVGPLTVAYALLNLVQLKRPRRR